MSLTAADVPARLRAGALVWPVLAVGAVMTAITLSQTVADAARGPADPDVLVRLQQVRDLLAGQGWFDLVQRRLGVPDGVPMHWSRLVDVPLALLIRALDGLLGRSGAELAAMLIWPAALGVAALGAVVSIAVRLGGPAAAWPAALMMLFAIHVRYLFSAGNIDHHNVQLALGLWLVAAVARLDTGARAGAAAGLIAAVMMAIGLETLPLVALAGAAAAAGLGWDARRFGAGALAFGVSFATGTAVLFVATMPPAGPGVLTCDVLSAPYLAAAVAGGLGLAGTARFAATAPARWAGLAATAVAAVAAGAILGPRCLTGPYAELDPALVARWLATVDEAKSFRQLMADDLAKAVAFAGAPLVGLGIALIRLRAAAADDRFAWGVVAGASALTIALMTHQIRGASFAAAFALPAGAWLIAQARARSVTLPGARGAVLLVGACLLPQGITYEGTGRALAALGVKPDVVLITTEMAGGGPATPVTACFDRSHFARLAALPPARILAPSNLGPSILAHTPHGALAGPYHRDRAGLIDSMDAFEDTGAKAREIARRRGLTLLAWCTGDSVMPGTALSHPGSLADQLVKGRVPDWLTPIDTAGPVRVYAIRP